MCFQIRSAALSYSIGFLVVLCVINKIRRHGAERRIEITIAAFHRKLEEKLFFDKEYLLWVHYGLAGTYLAQSKASGA